MDSATTAADLRAVFQNRTDAFIDHDMARYRTIKAVAFKGLYSPSKWSDVSSDLYSLLSGDDSVMSPEESHITGLTTAHLAIRCSDTKKRTKSPQSLVELAERVQRMKDFWRGEHLLPVLHCAVWPFLGHEIYQGSFQASTKTPILFVAGSNDPVTPLASAKNASAGFDGSVVLVNDGYRVSNCVDGRAW